MTEEKKKKAKQEEVAETPVEVEAPEMDSEVEVAEEAQPSPNILSEPVLQVSVQGEKVKVVKYDEVYEDGVVIGVKIYGANGCTYSGMRIENGVLI